jgi:multiple sugar transport system permease protein
MRLGYRAQRRLSRALSSVAMGIYLLMTLFPIYWMLLTAIKPSGELYVKVPTLWTPNPTMANLQHLFVYIPYLKMARNTFFVAFASTAIAVVVASLTGYSLSRLRFPGRDFLASAVFFTYLIPTTMILIPTYVLFARLHLLESLTGLVLTSLAAGTPFSVWMLKGYFATIPGELEDAARVDGSTRMQALYLIILPLAAPGMVACAIFTFTSAWQQYLWPLVLNNKRDLWTLAVGLASMMVNDVFLWGEIMGGAFLMGLPVLVLYFLGQRFLVGGLTAGAVKG